MEFGDIMSTTKISTGWQAPSISLGDARTNGAVETNNAGAGFRYTFDAASNDEIRLNIKLDWNDIAYDGSSLDLVLDNQLFDTAPSASDDVVWEVDYAFLKSDGTEDAEDKVTANSDTIVVDARTENLLYEDVLSSMTGLAGATGLQITLRRLSTGSGEDSYDGAVDIYQLRLNKA